MKTEKVADELGCINSSWRWGSKATGGQCPVLPKIIVLERSELYQRWGNNANGGAALVLFARENYAERSLANVAPKPAQRGQWWSGEKDKCHNYNLCLWSKSRSRSCSSILIPDKIDQHPIYIDVLLESTRTLKVPLDWIQTAYITLVLQCDGWFLYSLRFTKSSVGKMINNNGWIFWEGSEL